MRNQFFFLTHIFEIVLQQLLCIDNCFQRMGKFSDKFSKYINTEFIYATGRQEEEDGKTLVSDKRDKAITCVFCRDLRLQKYLFKGSLAKSYFKQNYCHACHTRLAVFFPFPSCCVSSLIFIVIGLSGVRFGL